MMWRTKIKSKADARGYAEEVLQSLPFYMHLKIMQLNIVRDNQDRIVVTVSSDDHRSETIYYNDELAEGSLTELIFQHRKHFNKYID